MTVQIILPRGIRNNNPLNIRLNPDNPWQGKVPPKHNSDGAFEQFQDPIMGLRAAAVLLITHYDRQHLDTIRAIGAIQETVGQAHEALVGVVPHLDAAKWGLLAVTLIGIGFMLWARIDDRRKGLR